MRAIWRGAVSFGLVSIPIRLYTATQERDVSFHQVHREDGGRIRYHRVCEADGNEVDYNDIAKGYQLPGGEMVVLTDEDLSDLPLPTSRAIDVLEFVPLDQVDPIYFAKSYYMEPDKAAIKPYILLRNALEKSNMVAIVKVAIRTKETLATLRVRDHVLVMETMMWPDEIRSPDFEFLSEKVRVRDQELSMAESLIDSMSGDFDPSQYHDEYRAALQEVIDAKVAGRELVTPEPAMAPAENVVELMAALRKSVEAAEQTRTGHASDGKTTEKRASSRPTQGKTAKASRKTAQKSAKSATGRTAAKKQTSRQTTKTTRQSANKTASTGRKTTQAKRPRRSA